jgi:hypothetical protein
MTARKCFAGLILIGASISTSVAIPLNYEIGSGSSVTAHNSGDGLVIKTELSPTLSSQAFTLNDGQSYTFNFFRIWTDESMVDSDDTVAKLITARLDFDVPDIGAKIYGLTFSGTYYGYSGGAVVWNDPVTVIAGDREFTVNLNNAYFDVAQGGLGDTPATITATVKQIRSGGSSIPVPDGGTTAVLLGAGLGAMLMRRRFSV